jgi:hypothetical protein
MYVSLPISRLREGGAFTNSCHYRYRGLKCSVSTTRTKPRRPRNLRAVEPMDASLMTSVVAHRHGSCFPPILFGTLLPTWAGSLNRIR